MVAEPQILYQLYDHAKQYDNDDVCHNDRGEGVPMFRLDGGYRFLWESTWTIRLRTWEMSRLSNR